MPERYIFRIVFFIPTTRRKTIPTEQTTRTVYSRHSSVFLRDWKAPVEFQKEQTDADVVVIAVLCVAGVGRRIKTKLHQKRVDFQYRISATDYWTRRVQETTTIVGLFANMRVYFLNKRENFIFYEFFTQQMTIFQTWRVKLRVNFAQRNLNQVKFCAKDNANFLNAIFIF